jgi:hypothetical protein
MQSWLLCVGLAEADKGPTPFIFVGKITTVNPQERTFKMKPMRCRIHPWTAACAKAVWYMPSRNQVNEEYPHYAVLGYVKSWTKNGKIPAPVQRGISERAIMWCE